MFGTSPKRADVGIGPYGGLKSWNFTFFRKCKETCRISPFLSRPWRGTLPPGEGMALRAAPLLLMYRNRRIL